MSKVRITSWNTQGDAINKISGNYNNIMPNTTSGLCQEEINNIILIQEAGATYGMRIPLKGKITQTYGRTVYNGFFSQHVTAANKRCTTGIMASEKAMDSYYMDIFDIKPEAVRRPVVIAIAQFKYFSLYIATVHATANHHVSGGEIKSIFDTIQKNAKDLNWKFLIMGDFNITPSELMHSENIPSTNIICTGRPTQLGGNELDYAVASPELAANIHMELGTNFCSDHFPVYIEFDPDMSL